MRINYYYTQDEIDYLKTIIKGRILPEINILYQDRFCRELTPNELFAFKRRYKIKSGKISNSKKGKYIYNFDQEEIEWLKKYISKEISSSEIIKMYKEKFNKDITYRALQRFKIRYKVKSGYDGTFKKGNPLNPNKSMSIGSERKRYEKDKIRVQIKISDKKWIDKSRYIYEQHYGKIPKNHVIIFLDGNRENFDIDNLRCITHKEHEIMAGNKLYFNNKDLNETSILIAKMIEKIKKLEK